MHAVSLKIVLQMVTKRLLPSFNCAYAYVQYTHMLVFSVYVAFKSAKAKQLPVATN